MILSDITDALGAREGVVFRISFFLLYAHKRNRLTRCRAHCSPEES